MRTIARVLWLFTLSVLWWIPTMLLMTMSCVLKLVALTFFLLDKPVDRLADGASDRFKRNAEALSNPEGKRYVVGVDFAIHPSKHQEVIAATVRSPKGIQ